MTRRVITFSVLLNLGRVNSEIEMLEGQLKNDTQDPCEAVATHMLTVMVRGLFIKMEFPFANFPSQGHTFFSCSRDIHVRYMYVLLV